jgi:DNA modification methylase
MKLSDLHPTPHNPREILGDRLTALAYSMQEFGDLSGIVLNRADWTQGGMLVCGHQRVAALTAAYGDIELDGDVIVTPSGERFSVRVVDWPREKHDAAMVVANSPEIQGQWTPAALPVLKSLEGFDGFAELRLPELSKSLLDEFPAAVEQGDTPEPQLDQAAELLKKWKVERGQVWQVGKHRVMCGDSTSAQDVGWLMQGVKAKVMATDPPYGVAYDNAARPNPGVAKPRVANDELTSGPKMQDFLEAMLRAGLPFMAEDAAFYFWHPMLTQGTYVAAAAAAGILIHRQIIWVKPGLLLGRGDYHWRHELCFYGWRQGNRPPFYGARNQDTVWEVGSVSPTERRAMNHPTPKPTALWTKPIENHTRKSELLYDPFLGSGTTAVACQQLGRVCYGMEIEPAYVAVTLDRLERMGLKPELAT